MKNVNLEESINSLDEYNMTFSNKASELKSSRNSSLEKDLKLPYISFNQQNNSSFQKINLSDYN